MVLKQTIQLFCGFRIIYEITETQKNSKGEN
jgi:hypothetical protein